MEIKLGALGGSARCHSIQPRWGRLIANKSKPATLAGLVRCIFQLCSERPRAIRREGEKANGAR